MKLNKKLIASAIALAFFVGIMKNNESQTLDILSSNNIEYKDTLLKSDNESDYYTSDYVITKNEYDNMIKENKKEVAPKNIKINNDYNFFVGYDPVTHKAIYTNKPIISNLATVNIKITGTWRVGSYWGQIMTNSATGEYLYCGNYGKPYPSGSFNYSEVSSTMVHNALSWAYPWIKTGNNVSDYGKSQMAIWKGQGKISPSASTLGVYEKVSEAIKGRLGFNSRTFYVNGTINNSTTINGINMSSISIKLSGNSPFWFTQTELNRLNNLGVAPYLKVNNIWKKITNSTKYTTANNELRFGSTNMNLNTSIKNIQIETDVINLAGFVWEAFNSTFQNIWGTKMLDPHVTFNTNAIFTQQTGSLKISKLMDGVDLYNTPIQNVNGDVLYATEDTKQVEFVDNDVVLSTIDFPSKTDMLAKTLYGKPISYTYPDYDIETTLVDELDANQQPILIVDENGVNPGEVGYIETHKQISVPKKNAQGIQIVKVKRDENNQPIMISKTLSTNYPNADVMNNIWKSDKVTFELYDSNRKAIKSLHTDVNALISFDGLTPGNYFVKETLTIPGYKLDTNIYPATITAGNSVTINNGKAIINYANAGDLVIVKENPLKKAIGGVTFHVFNEVNGECDLNDEITTVTTHIDGKASVNVPAGKYCVQEVSTQWEYVLDPTLKHIEITDDNQTVITLVNDFALNTFNIKKIQTGTVDLFVKGAIIGVYGYDSDGKSTLLQKITSSGKLDVLELSTKYLKYGFKELEAPTGYVLNNKEVFVYVTEAGITFDVKIENTLEAVLIGLPKTGYDNLTPILIIGSLLLVGTIGIVTYRKVR